MSTVAKIIGKLVKPTSPLEGRAVSSKMEIILWGIDEAGVGNERIR
jgi:hypothetical protein